MSEVKPAAQAARSNGTSGPWSRCSATGTVARVASARAVAAATSMPSKCSMFEGLNCSRIGARRASAASSTPSASSRLETLKPATA